MFFIVQSESPGPCSHPSRHDGPPKLQEFHLQPFWCSGACAAVVVSEISTTATHPRLRSTAALLPTRANAPCAWPACRACHPLCRQRGAISKECTNVRQLHSGRCKRALVVDRVVARLDRIAVPLHDVIEAPHLTSCSDGVQAWNAVLLPLKAAAVSFRELHFAPVPVCMHAALGCAMQSWLHSTTQRSAIQRSAAQRAAQRSVQQFRFEFDQSVIS